MTDEEKEKAVVRFFRIAPGYSDERISDIFRLPVERIAELRAGNDTESREAEMSSVRA